jgi:hypothetical protein
MADVSVLHRRARIALELGRARAALFSAALVGAALALVATLGVRALGAEAIDPRWLALPVLVWGVIAFVGGALARGGLAGLVAGAAGWVLPMWALRPCCVSRGGEMMSEAAMRASDCCTRPDCCLGAGAALGLVIALAVPRPTRRGRRDLVEELLGATLVAASTLGARCAGMFVGETAGLLGGLVMGAVIAGGVRAYASRPALA